MPSQRGSSTPHRVLLVGPVFHGYTTTVADALSASGHVVTVHHYDERPGLVGRVRRKLVDELPARVGGRSRWPERQRRATDAALHVLREVRPDVVLAIRADVLTVDFWDEARRLGALTHLWLYDELRRMNVDTAVLRTVDVLTSYSAGDTASLVASGIETQHLLNGFDARTPWRAVPSDDVLFVGARYPNRAALLVALRERGLPVVAVGRDWSHHPYDRIRGWDPQRPDVPARRDVTRAESYGLMAGAAANLNVHHNQDGFTMRTFEIPGTGGLQLVDRADVDTLYVPDEEVLVFSSHEEAADLAARALADRAWARRIGEAGRRRTMAEHTMDQRVRQLEALWTA